MKGKTCLIAGGGIGGLTAALALLKRGFKVKVLEKAPQLGEVGAGVQISANGMRVLCALGLESEIRKVSFEPTAREMRIWNTGVGSRTPVRAAENVARFGFPHVTMHRADLHQILVDAVRAISSDAIRLGANCTGFRQGEAGVEVHLEEGSSIAGDLLVGADGIHSTVRRQLFGASRATFTGGVAWRGIVPVERLPERMRDRTVQIWIGTNGHCVVYPIRGGELINFVGHVERDDWRVESWIEAGETAEFANDFNGWHGEIQTLIKTIDQPYKWALFLHETLPAWSVRRVTLLGDACHPTLPYLAQGANMAIEDGYILARCLADEPKDIPAALRLYDHVRIPRTTKIVRASADNEKRFHHRDLGEPKVAKQYLDSAWDEQQSIRAWVYAFDAVSSSLTPTPDFAEGG